MNFYFPNYLNFPYKNRYPLNPKFSNLNSNISLENNEKLNQEKVIKKEQKKNFEELNSSTFTENNDPSLIISLLKNNNLLKADVSYDDFILLGLICFFSKSRNTDIFLIIILILLLFDI